jgi:hypothetical protein
MLDKIESTRWWIARFFFIQEFLEKDVDLRSWGAVLGAVNLSLGGRFFENCVVYIGLESFLFFFKLYFPVGSSLVLSPILCLDLSLLEKSLTFRLYCCFHTEKLWELYTPEQLAVFSLEEKEQETLWLSWADKIGATLLLWL